MLTSFWKKFLGCSRYQTFSKESSAIVVYVLPTDVLFNLNYRQTVKIYINTFILDDVQLYCNWWKAMHFVHMLIYSICTFRFRIYITKHTYMHLKIIVAAKFSVLLFFLINIAKLLLVQHLYCQCWPTDLCRNYVIVKGTLFCKKGKGIWCKQIFTGLYWVLPFNHKVHLQLIWRDKLIL